MKTKMKAGGAKKYAKGGKAPANAKVTKSKAGAVQTYTNKQGDKVKKVFDSKGNIIDKQVVKKGDQAAISVSNRTMNKVAEGIKMATNPVYGAQKASEVVGKAVGKKIVETGAALKKMAKDASGMTAMEKRIAKLEAEKKAMKGSPSIKGGARSVGPGKVKATASAGPKTVKKPKTATVTKKVSAEDKEMAVKMPTKSASSVMAEATKAAASAQLSMPKTATKTSAKEKVGAAMAKMKENRIERKTNRLKKKASKLGIEMKKGGMKPKMKKGGKKC